MMRVDDVGSPQSRFDSFLGAIRRGLIAAGCVLLAACTQAARTPSIANEEDRNDLRPASDEEILAFVTNAIVTYEPLTVEGSRLQGGQYCSDRSVHASQSRVRLTGRWRVADRMLCTQMGSVDAPEVCRPLLLDQSGQMFALDGSGAMVAAHRSIPDQNYCSELEP